MTLRPLRIRAWSTSDGFPEQAGRPHHPGTRPLGVAISGGGFRSYSCGVGQLRALHDLGILPRVGALSAVSGGAWLSSLFSFAPGEASTQLGPHVPPDEVTLELLDDCPVGSFLRPVTEVDTLGTVRRGATLGIPGSRRFAALLADQILEPLGVEARRPLLAMDALHRTDLLERNPLLSADDVLVARPDRPFLIAGAALVRNPGRYQSFVPLELTPAYTSVPADLQRPDKLALVETAALMTEGLSAERPGILHGTLREGGFGLADIWATSGHAPGSLLTRLAGELGLALDNVVPRSASWTTADLHRPSPVVDGGNLENLGLVPLLRRGFDRILVLVNSNTTVGSGTSHNSAGIDGQIGRLFGRPPTGGQYADDPYLLFEPDELDQVAAGMLAAQERGEMPWHLGEVHVTALNVAGLPPRKVQILWMVNERPAGWVERLHSSVQSSLGLTALTSGLTRFPHFSVAFPDTTDLFRMRARQVQLLAHMWDHAVRDRAPQLRVLLGEAEPFDPDDDGGALDPD